MWTTTYVSQSIFKSCSWCSQHLLFASPWTKLSRKFYVIWHHYFNSVLMFCNRDLHGLVLALFSFQVNKIRYILKAGNCRMINTFEDFDRLPVKACNKSSDLKTLMKYVKDHLYVKWNISLHNVPSQYNKENNLYKLSVNVQQIICMASVCVPRVLLVSHHCFRIVSCSSPC